MGTATRTSTTACLWVGLLLTGCGAPQGDGTVDPPAPTATEEANSFFERAYLERIAASPMTMASLGMKERYGEWDDFSDAQARRNLQTDQRHRRELLERIDASALDDETRLSYDLFLKNLNDRIEAFPFRFHGYPVNQMSGVQSRLPAFMLNVHRVTNIDDAEAYIERLAGWGVTFDQVIDGLVVRAAKGIIAPRFVFNHVLNDCRNVLAGRPFDGTEEDSVLLRDFKTKVTALGLDDEVTEDLVARATAALADTVGPAYRRMMLTVEAIQARADDDDGAWKLPRGEEFYALALRRATTTELGAEEIHELGLGEVARIQEEMRAIMAKLSFDGSLQDFFDFMATDPQFYLPDTADGRRAYLAQATAIIDNMYIDLPKLFHTRPEALLQVKPVEPFREQSAGKAFYQRPAPDGSRPGVYYANLFRMRDMPTYQMEALAYHEGLPGHHLQTSVAQRLEDLPRFRRFGSYTAYSEGWGLYSELLPKELGRYADPYSDFGRLAMELWRACRLVVDTGIHHKRWTRERAIEYLQVNTPNPDNDAVKAIERYIVMPGQATAYKIGMLKILELRQSARQRLGDDFDLRDFHDAVLGSGPVPLDVLERLVDRYIEGGSS